MITHDTIESFARATGFSIAMIKAHRITESGPHQLDRAALPPATELLAAENTIDRPEPMLDQP